MSISFPNSSRLDGGTWDSTDKPVDGHDRGVLGTVSVSNVSEVPGPS